MNATMPDGQAAPATPDQPVGGAERLVTLDFIRGVAVLGILLANVVAFGHPLIAYSWPGALPGPMSIADNIVWQLQYLFIDGKMRGLFTLLFGAGMMLFMQRAWARGATRWLQARRLVWLMLFGLAHFFFLFWGDILFLYSLAGLIALAMVRWDADKLIRVGVFWYAIGGLFLAGTLGAQLLVELGGAGQAVPGGAHEALAAAWEERQAEAAAENAAFAQGSYREQLAFMTGQRSELLAQYPFFALFETVPLMLVGMGLYAKGLFSGGFDPAGLRKWGWIGLGTGAVLSLPFGLWAGLSGYPPYLTEFVTNGVAQLLRLPMILGLAALLAVWSADAARGWLGQRLVAAGRMAFSNYLGTSLVMMVLFRGWGGGLFGELGRVELLGPVLLGWALMLAWSQPWLARFRYGPLEWLWRCLTYWRLFPLRR